MATVTDPIILDSTGQDIVTALNNLNTPRDTAAYTTSFASSDTDDASATSWTVVPPIAGGETHATLFGKLSQIAKNVRYLKNLLNDNVWQDVTSEFTKNVTGARAMILFNKFTNEMKIQMAGGAVGTGAVWLTIPSKYTPNASLMTLSSGTQYYVQGISVGRFTQNPSSASQIYTFVGTPIYDSSTNQIKINFPLGGTAYGVQSDIRYIVA